VTTRGYKVKGYQRIDLSWSGARSQSVDIYRNGAPITTTPNDGFHTDAINRKGGGSYRYQIREAGGSSCSAEATVAF
jgi:serine protease